MECRSALVPLADSIIELIGSRLLTPNLNFGMSMALRLMVLRVDICWLTLLPTVNSSAIQAAEDVLNKFHTYLNATSWTEDKINASADQQINHEEQVGLEFTFRVTTDHVIRHFPQEEFIQAAYKAYIQAGAARAAQTVQESPPLGVHHPNVSQSESGRRASMHDVHLAHASQDENGGPPLGVRQDLQLANSANVAEQALQEVPLLADYQGLKQPNWQQVPQGNNTASELDGTLLEVSPRVHISDT